MPPATWFPICSRNLEREQILSTPESPTPPADVPSPQDLKLAIKAFKKRLKLTRLDAESRLGVGPMSSGTDWGITAIMPPIEYPRSVWDELVKQGKLKHAGHGLYSLVQQ